jgi:DNA gyrase inhibitor GyrI
MRRAAPAALLASLFLAGCSVFGGKAAEEPDHTVIREDGPYEIREYAPYAVALTTSGGSRDDAAREGFLRLFDYISGENEGSREIAMTAPVLTEPERADGEGEEIAMTAPVLTEETARGWQVGFVLPEGMTAEAAPRPTNADVRIEDRPARRIAVRRFSGFNTPEKAERNRELLAGWLEEQGLAPEGDWRVAGYHPPWTIPWLRRYEVWVTLE